MTKKLQNSTTGRCTVHKLKKWWWLGPTDFREPWNFKPSCRICPFLRHFDIAAPG